MASSRHVNHLADYHAIHKLAQSALSPTVHATVMLKDVEERWFQDRPMEDTTHDQTPSKQYH